MRRGNRRFRLGNAQTNDLMWLFVQADADIAGLAGQGYEPSSLNTSPEKLFLQERLAGFEDGPIARQYRLFAIANRMVSDDPRGALYWGWLKIVYALPKTRDPFEEFDKDLAPLVRHTPAALGRAEKRWPHWHLERHGEHYEAVYERLRRELGGASQAAVTERMMNLIPDDAYTAGEAEEVLSEVIDGACLRAKNAEKGWDRLSPADRSFLDAAERQADEMLSDASLAFYAAMELVDEELRARGRDQERTTDRMRAAEAVVEVLPVIDQQIAACDRLLENWPEAKGRARFWAAKRAERAADVQVGEENAAQ